MHSAACVEVTKDPIQGGTYTLGGVTIVGLGRSYGLGFFMPGAPGPNPSARHVPAPFARPPFGEHSGRPSGSLRAPRTAKEHRPTTHRKKNRNLRTSGDGEV